MSKLSNKKVEYPNTHTIKKLMKKGISLDLYLQRLRQGWAEEKAQNEKPRKSDSFNNYKQFTDFELDHLIENHISYMDYKNRRSLGWSREEAVFIPKGIKRYQILNHDYYPVNRHELKIIYQHESTIDTYRTRRALGWSKDEALTTPKK
ncbi:hypothetical protein [Staphylococcus pettenkoferi]|uniref:hypothetical protein n=1 Tax=Staphylococcus pettenkoferi TaxID=170573 RepID=UPI0025527394|nr:hypothetical protein [Staphylococcus pettenkoferi]MDK7284306.1 hypothetical protein [Staphylococcus pettenkoferi]